MNIIIPSDNPELVRNLLQSIVDLDPHARVTYIIVTKDDVAMANGINGIPLDIRVESYGKDKEFNFARSINIGITSYSNDGDWMLLNDDTELDKEGGVQEMASLLKSSGHSMGVVSAGIKGVAGVTSQQAGSGNALRVAPEGMVSFVAVGISAKCLSDVGPLDEQFVAYGWEDIDYCKRARDAGYEIGVFDGCIFKHEKPHSTFSQVTNVGLAQLQGELIYNKKHSTLTENPVIVIGASQSGASVISAMLHRMGIDMADPHPDRIASTSQYYRDTDFKRLLKMGPTGVVLYGFRRSLDSDGVWGFRVWPSPEHLSIITRVFPKAVYIVAGRGREAIIKSTCLHRGVKRIDAEARTDNELSDLSKCMEILEGVGKVHVVNSEDIAFRTEELANEIAKWIGYPKGVEAAVETVNRSLIHFDNNGDLIERGSPQDFGRIAVGVRASSPQPAFVASLASLTKNGLREGDILLPVQHRVPSHIAANELCRSFMASGADTLLLLDDDMTFDEGLLSRMRDNEKNWEFGVVSALATQRIVPPRAIVLREDVQPPLPDSLDGVYYELAVDEVDITKTMKVGATGFAFTLIRREVLEAMTSEHGPRHTWYVQWGQGGVGEDVWFCQQAGSYGYEIGVDCAAHVGHIGSVVYGYDEFDAWRKSQRRSGAGVGLGDLEQIVGESIQYLPEDINAKAVDLLAKIGKNKTNG